MSKHLMGQLFCAILLVMVLISVPSHGAKKDNSSTATEHQTGGSPFDIKSMLSGYLPSSGGDIRQQASAALGFLKYAFIGTPKKYTPSGQCVDHVTEFFKAVLSGEMWALKSKYRKSVSLTGGGSDQVRHQHRLLS